MKEIDIEVIRMTVRIKSTTYHALLDYQNRHRNKNGKKRSMGKIMDAALKQYLEDNRARA